MRPLRNAIHASDAIEDGEKEVALWFKPEELFSYERADEKIMFP
jgi:nucleoside-diphosphate kinase